MNGLAFLFVTFCYECACCVLCACYQCIAFCFSFLFFKNQTRDDKPRFPSDGGSRRFGGRDSLYPQRGPGGPGGNTAHGGGLMPPSSSPQHSQVLMAYNLPMSKINCDKLFNLLCLYGNVTKVSSVISCCMSVLA